MFHVANPSLAVILVACRRDGWTHASRDGTPGRRRQFAMALHRDIYWVGRQWAVTGYGIQACDQKQKGQFDIEGSKLWDEGVQDNLRGQKWLNAEDFEKAVAVARKYFPEPSRSPEPPEKTVFQPENEVRRTGLSEPVIEERQARGRGLAKFIPVWRVRTRLGVPGKDK
jgi:hypothetical protein